MGSKCHAVVLQPNRIVCKHLSIGYRDGLSYSNQYYYVLITGEVMVWDYSKENDMLIASSGKGDDSHNEPVSKVMWQKVAGKRRQYNVSREVYGIYTIPFTTNSVVEVTDISCIGEQVTRRLRIA